MSECRVGSLAWFAGVWWLTLSWAIHWLARWCARWGPLWLAWVLVRWTERTAEAAVTCAKEGGYRDEI